VILSCYVVGQIGGYVASPQAEGSDVLAIYRIVSFDANQCVLQDAGEDLDTAEKITRRTSALRDSGTLVPACTWRTCLLTDRFGLSPVSIAWTQIMMLDAPHNWKKGDQVSYRRRTVIIIVMDHFNFSWLFHCTAVLAVSEQLAAATRRCERCAVGPGSTCGRLADRVLPR